MSEAVYDNIFDVFGTLRDTDYLDRLIRKQKQEEKRQREQERSWSSYYNQYQRTYSSSGFASTGNYTEADKAHLKKFYRLLSQKFHPDVNPDHDTSEEMKLVNRLKDDWGI